MAPEEHEKLIGSPQTIARFVNVDGRQALVRLQIPYLEYGEGSAPYINQMGPDGKLKEGEIAENEMFEPMMVIEMWSDATKCIVSLPITRPDNRSIKLFTYGCRYMMNHATDEDILDLIKKKNIDVMLKYTAGDIEIYKLLGNAK
jgi:hypothetical protein